jgi:phospholipid/cholesterol/gamma-HCH transport system substrate-binding protein
MEGERRLKMIVGAFAVMALSVFALTVLSLTAQRGFFDPRYTLIAHFENVLGLQQNAPIWLAGREVGRVETVSFGDLGGAQPIEVELRIDTDVQELIRSNSTASVGTIGVLGDSYIEIGIGTLEAEPLRDGEEITTLTPVGLGALISKAGRALDSIATLASNVDGVVSELDGSNVVGKLGETTLALSELMVEIRDGEGLLHSLVYDNYNGSGVESIEQSLASLDHILNEVRTGNGILHELIYKDTNEQDLIVEVLEAGARLNSILAKVDRGEGSLGLILNDPTLYEDLKILVGGAQRSTVVRTMIRMSLESGRDATGEALSD